jgi:RimJ/RimL family protein N-acetyltransferase
MAFGPRMRVSVGELEIELAPFTKAAMAEFVDGLQQHDVIKYLSRKTAPTLEDEFEYYDNLRADMTRLAWGVWLIAGEGENAKRTLIGSTSLFDITRQHVHQATSGSMIFRQEYWGKGIASHIHKARTWYAFQHLGLHRVMSAVVHGNVGSRKALERSGYALVYVERNTTFGDGKLRHQDNLECLNPIDSFWGQWWHGDTPTQRSKEARKITKEAMDWAQQHVKLS